MAALNVVSSATAPPAPYPPDTKAKGWKFVLDSERIRQSDTWALAGGLMRPWLLRLWLEAWDQIPCGSLPSHDTLIAARIEMDQRQFTAHRDILMRGWWLASDGRMYHPVITEQVLGLIAMREKEAARKQAWRDKQDQLLASKCPTGQPRDYSVTPPSVTAPEPEPEPFNKQTTSVVKPSASPAASRCPQSEIVALFGEVLPECRQPAKWDGSRAQNLAARWREDEARQSIEWWRKLFEYIRDSDFLMGRVAPRAGHAQFRMGLDWLVTKANFLKVVEGAYENA